MRGSVHRITAGAAILGLVTGMAGTALASDVDTAVVDTGSPTNSITVDPGDTVDLVVTWQVTGRQTATATFEIDTTWTLEDDAFTGATPVTETVAARVATAPATTGSRPVTLTVACDQADGVFTLSVPAYDIVTTSPAALGEGTFEEYEVTVTGTPAESCEGTAPANTAPVVQTAAPDAFGVEGDTLSTGGTFVDADADSLTLFVPVGTAGSFTDNGDGSWEWELPTTDDVARTAITVTASDGNGGIVTDTFDYEADNAAPVVGSIGVTATGACSVSISAAFTDAGTGDTHAAVIDWGDDASTDPAAVQSNTVTGSHTFGASGAHVVTVTVTDDDSGSHQSTATFGTKNVPSAVLDPIGRGTMFKAGSSIPIKITVADCSGATVDALSPAVAVSKLDTTVSGEVIETGLSSQVATNGKNMSWDGAQYVYVLSTKNSQFTGTALGQGTYRITITDPTFLAPVTATFDLKK